MTRTPVINFGGGSQPPTELFYLLAISDLWRGPSMVKDDEKDADTLHREYVDLLLKQQTLVLSVADEKSLLKEIRAKKAAMDKKIGGSR
jgi:hypothetical protein